MHDLLERTKKVLKEKELIHGLYEILFEFLCIHHSKFKLKDK